MTIYSMGQKKDLVKYRPVSMTLVPGEVMEQIVLSASMWHVLDNQGIWPRQDGFGKGSCCLSNLISFYDMVIHLVDEGKAVDFVCLGFCKAFDIREVIVPLLLGPGEAAS